MYRATLKEFASETLTKSAREDEVGDTRNISQDFDSEGLIRNFHHQKASISATNDTVISAAEQVAAGRPHVGEIIQHDSPVQAERVSVPSDNDVNISPPEHQNSPLVAVTVAMRSGLQLQHHFNVAETLQTVANWGRSSRAIASDDTEEFIILHPPVVRFTPSNLKRTLEELKLPTSVHLSVVRKTKSPNDGHILSAVHQPMKPEGLDLSRVISPVGTPV